MMNSVAVDNGLQSLDFHVVFSRWTHLLARNLKYLAPILHMNVYSGLFFRCDRFVHDDSISCYERELHLGQDVGVLIKRFWTRTERHQQLASFAHLQQYTGHLVSIASIIGIPTRKR
jgi:hypothetical protein